MSDPRKILKFIKLHTKISGGEFFLNQDAIVSIYWRDECSFVRMLSDEESWEVIETPEEIFALIEANA